VHKQGYQTPRLPLTQKALTLCGLAVLTFLVALPVSDAAILLHDFNYVFWLGQALPTVVIITLVALVFFYFLWTLTMGPQGTENINLVLTLVSTFICLLGLTLVLSSLWLYWTGFHVTSALMYNCMGSTVSHDIRQNFLGLLALRQSPACSSKFSIEECAGYSTAAPPAFANYFQSLETHYSCSGFCYTPSQTNSSLLETPSKDFHIISKSSMSSVGQTSASFLSAREQTDVRGTEAARMHRELTLPPALFSQNAYKTSCDGAAARNLTFLALGFSRVWWMVGVVLIGLSALISFGDMCIGSAKTSSANFQSSTEFAGQQRSVHFGGRLN